MACWIFILYCIGRRHLASAEVGDGKGAIAADGQQALLVRRQRQVCDVVAVLAQLRCRVCLRARERLR